MSFGLLIKPLIILSLSPLLCGEYYLIYLVQGPYDPFYFIIIYIPKIDLNNQSKRWRDQSCFLYNEAISWRPRFQIVSATGNTKSPKIRSSMIVIPWLLISLIKNSLVAAPREYFIIVLLVRLMLITLKNLRRRRWFIERLRSKGGKKWLPFMPLLDPSSLSTSSRWNIYFPYVLFFFQLSLIFQVIDKIFPLIVSSILYGKTLLAVILT